jgi:hypothetical protein
MARVSRPDYGGVVEPTTNFGSAYGMTVSRISPKWSSMRKWPSSSDHTLRA